MQLSWSTLVLEVVNFLVLVWLLKRFLYKPVLRVIEERRSAIEKTLTEAATRDADAKALQEKYESRLADWDREKERLRQELNREIQLQRERLTAELHQALEAERSRQAVLSERHMAELEAQAGAKGTRLGLQFLTRLLERIAGPELEGKLLSVALEDLPLLPDGKTRTLQEACRDSRDVVVASAYPLSAVQRDAIARAISAVANRPVTPAFREDSHLLAGVQIHIGPWMLRANLQDELAFFAEKALDGA